MYASQPPLKSAQPDYAELSFTKKISKSDAVIRPCRAVPTRESLRLDPL